MRSELQILVALASVVVAAVAVTAHAGPVSDLYRGGAFGLPWNASSGAIAAKYPGGQWDTDTEGRKRYCAPTRQPLLQLPHQTRELCFLTRRRRHDGERDREDGREPRLSPSPMHRRAYRG